MEDNILMQEIHYQICNDCGISESDSTEIATQSIYSLTIDVAVKFIKWAVENNEYSWTGETWDENTGHDDFETLTHEELFTYFIQHIYNKE